MKNEINKDFYCSAGFNKENNYYDLAGDICPVMTGEQPCSCCHRKHPTPEQYKGEYGKEYPADGEVCAYIKDDENTGWYIGYHASVKYMGYQMVCACTPFGKPDKNWRPE
jgi:hypothetical protein